MKYAYKHSKEINANSLLIGGEEACNAFKNKSMSEENFFETLKQSLLNIVSEIDAKSKPLESSRDWEIVSYSDPFRYENIKSVRRISDNTIFFIGDSISDGYTTMVVEKIQVENSSVVLVGNIGNMQLRFAKKLKPILFTEDAVNEKLKKTIKYIEESSHCLSFNDVKKVFDKWKFNNRDDRKGEDYLVVYVTPVLDELSEVVKNKLK